MLHIGDELAHFLADALESSGGLSDKMPSNLPEGRNDPSFTRAVRVVRGQIPVMLLEKHSSHHGPLCAVYCRRVINNMRERFTAASGSAEIVVEGTASSESVERLAELSSALVLSIMQILAQMKGEWGVGGYFGGGWEVHAEPMKSGGLQYSQTSKVVMSVDIRRN